MEQPIIKKFSIDGLLQISRPVFPDDRGFFKEIIRTSEIEKILGKEFIIKQANHSRSTKNTLRGIHIAPWNKLIYVVKGKVQAVVADCRKDSATFGKHESIIIGEENKSSIFIPAGCGNSYLVLSEDADYIYLTDQEYAPNLEKSIAWNDSTLAIKWQLEGEPLLSEKDKMNPPFLSI
jgi:dTDP-4-dehydrorhamnose 3,5-epimerase